MAVADSIEEVSALIREVVVLHREMLTEDGLPIPEPKSSTQLVEMQDVCRCYNSCSCVLHSGKRYFQRRVSSDFFTRFTKFSVVSVQNWTVGFKR